MTDEQRDAKIAAHDVLLRVLIADFLARQPDAATRAADALDAHSLRLSGPELTAEIDEWIAQLRGAQSPKRR
jgi:hypothetical protein